MKKKIKLFIFKKIYYLLELLLSPPKKRTDSNTTQ